MFNSPKISESCKSSFLNPSDEAVNDTCKSFILPKITSTPRNSIFATPPKSLVLTPRRYSLSEIATPPRNSRREFVRLNSSQNPPGPLLASTKYNINVSTFEDVKSPGLANRIVQYNEEAEREKEQRRPATHQAKYGSLGLFPVVHLFKKKLPLLEQKPRHVTVRVASPDYTKHTPDYNRRLLDSIVRPGGSNQRGPSHLNLSENSTGTRSVLDALKEISRKRIHAHEELELLGENGKRIRTDSEDCTDSNKRLRDESPLLETPSPTRPASKKICMYDEYAASRSSMDFLRKSDLLVPKRKSISTTTENSKDSKQVKLINAETQTLQEEDPSKKELKELKEDNNQTDAENDKLDKVETVLKVFDDAPLERIRKNRLAALMGTLVGKDPILEPKPDYSSLLQDDTNEPKTPETADKTNKPLISILTPLNKSPNKSDKHVHFNIPESNSQSSKTSAVTITENSTTETVETSENNKLEIATAPPINTDLSSSISSAATPTFSFGTKSTPNISPAPISSNSSTNIPSLFPNKPIVESHSSFGIDVTKPSVITSPSVTTSSPPKVGGFKFDLAKPASSVSTPSTKPSSPFGHPSTTANLLSSITSAKTFVSPLTNSKTETNINTGAELFQKVSDPDKFSKPNFSFGPVSTVPSNTNFSFDEAKPVSTPASNSSTVLFGAISSTNSGFSTVTTSAKTSFSTITSVANKHLITSPSVTSNFGSTSASILPAFGTGVTSVNTTFKPPTFGNLNATNAPTFGTTNTTNAPTFGSANTTNAPTFGTTNTTNAPTFGTANTTNAPTFGTTNTTNAPTFGTANTTNAPPTFGTTNTTNAPTFGTANTTNAPTFGSSDATNNFGTINVTNSGFGIGTNTNTGGFGTTPAFGITNTSGNSGFGTSTTSGSFGTTTSGGFGTSKSSANSTFGGQTNSGFGTFATTASNIFGTSTTTKSGFGTIAATTPKPMANSFTTPPNLNSGFGTSVTTAGGFNAGNFGPVTNSTTFGTPTTAAFGFGGTNTTSVNTFGAPTTTVAAGFGTTGAGFGTNSGSLFGNTNMPSFGGSSNASFGSTSSASSFADGPFGVPTTSNSVFGSAPTTTTSSFVSDGNNKIFGGTTATFGAPTTTSSIFGTTQSPFGSSVTTATSPAIPFAFSAKTTANNTFGTTTTTASFGMGFGQNATGFSNQQSSNFGTQNKAPIFGNTNTSAFGGGSTASQGFGTTQQQQPFGTAGPAFSKPQSAPNAFGSSQFSFNQQQQHNNTSNFGTATTQPGVFTFGSGAAEKPGGFNFSGASSGEAPKKFDFSGSGAAPPAFGASFGNNTVPAVPNFGATAPVAGGGFSIGAGPPASNRPRPMIKGKRRT